MPYREDASKSADREEPEAAGRDRHRIDAPGQSRNLASNKSATLSLFSVGMSDGDAGKKKAPDVANTIPDDFEVRKRSYRYSV